MENLLNISMSLHTFKEKLIKLQKKKNPHPTQLSSSQIKKKEIFIFIAQRL